MVRLEIVGGGKMGEALLGGLLAAGWAEPDQVAVVEKVPARRHELAARYPGVAVLEELVPAEGALVAVKPGDVPATCAELGALGIPRILSIAAGVTTATLQEAAGEGTAVVRSMPNTPSVVGGGASAIAPGPTASEDDLDWAQSLLEAVGVVVRVSEPQLDAVTGLSGSGPAYVFLIAESLIEAGVLMGLSREVSEVLAVQTLRGSAELLHASDEHAAALRGAVTSPGGTTAAGLHALEVGGLRAAILEAVKAATERSRQLGQA